MSTITLIILIAAYHHGATGQSICTTPTGATGTCKSVYQCQSLLAPISNPERTSLEMFTMQKSQCGFEDTTPTVCCPEPCQTPDGKAGECINIYQCNELANRLRAPVTKQNMDFVVNSRCASEDQYGVCCPLPVQGNCKERVSAFPPDPRSQCCGVDNVVGNKIVGGTETALDQYPWLAIIEYIKDGRLNMLCGSTLISGKYVLTAGHCVTGPILDFGKPTNIRLAEYDTSNEGEDCIQVEAGGVDCNSGITVIPIEKLIPHPEYNPTDRLKKNDIALIRMTQMAPYNDFIRPICLPVVDYTLQPPANFELFVAGWGATNTTVLWSKVKLHVNVPYAAPEVCQRVYQKINRLWEKQLCAGGEKGKDSCMGDSGGPLMYYSGKTYEAIGIVSLGPKPCGSKNKPGIYTNVYKYKDWIRSNIEP